MTENFEYKGEWFLPENFDERISGTLYYKKGDGVYLELFGDLDFAGWETPIILGITNNSKSITLYNCLVNTRGGITLSRGKDVGMPSNKYSISYILEGCHIEKVEDLKFTSISTEFYNLPQWVGLSGFQPMELERLLKREIAIEYKPLDSISFEIDEKTKGLFYFGYTTPGMSEYDVSKTIEQNVQVVFLFNKPETLDVSLSYLFGFQKFLMLALYAPSYPYDMFLIHKDSEGNTERLKFYFPISRNMHIEKLKFSKEMLFSFGTVRLEFNTIIQQWYKRQEELAPAYDLVIEHLYNQSEFTVNTFLNLAQAAETYHVRTSNRSKVPKADYDKMKEEILKTTPAIYHDWLKNQFNFGNNLNLHDRLTEMVAKFSFPMIDTFLGDKKQFVLNVKRSRNYYTHYSSDSKKHALKGSQLFYLSGKLKVLLVCSFLIEIGIKEETLQAYFEYNKSKWFFGL